MCRLYGFRANEPTKVECTLVYAQNALLIQSRSDRRGESHPDGWGIGVYEAGCPRVERRDTAAHCDLRFSLTAERSYSSTILAHIRNATVGGTALSNTHPFVHGRWMFAHNGTVIGFDQLRCRIASLTDPDLVSSRLGTTDSEAVFFWLLTRIRAAGVDLDSGRNDVKTVAAAVARSIDELHRLCAPYEVEKKAKLNFLLTDGSAMIASRWGNTLVWVSRNGVRDCEICGIPHVQHQKRTDYRAAVVASEPISNEAWNEVPEHSMLIIEPSISATIEPI